MAEAEIGELLDEALEREGVKDGNWSASSHPDPTTEDGGADIREHIEVKYLGAPNESEKFSLPHPRTAGVKAEEAALQREVFVKAVCEKIGAIKRRIKGD